MVGHRGSLSLHIPRLGFQICSFPSGIYFPIETVLNLAVGVSGQPVRHFGIQGTWVAHSVECLALDFGSGHDLVVHGFEARVGLCADSVEPA